MNLDISTLVSNETAECLTFQQKRKTIHSAGIHPNEAYKLDTLDKSKTLDLFQLHAEGMPLSSIRDFLEYKYAFSDSIKALARYWRRTQPTFRAAAKAYKAVKAQRRLAR